MTEDAQKYEISLMLASEESYPDVASLIGTMAVKIIQENPVRRMRLAYPIRKKEIGFFTWFVVAMSPARISSLEHDLRMNPAVIRSLIVTPPLPIKTERQASRIKEIKEKIPKKLPRSATIRSRVAADNKVEETLSNELLEKKLEEILK